MGGIVKSPSDPMDPIPYLEVFVELDNEKI
jgi:hypothetical protein